LISDFPKEFPKETVPQAILEFNVGVVPSPPLEQASDRQREEVALRVVREAEASRWGARLPWTDYWGRVKEPEVEEQRVQLALDRGAQQIETLRAYIRAQEHAFAGADALALR
jgi:hypothetical protein